jgi:hypothetical protein
MKSILKLAFTVVLAVAACSTLANAQTYSVVLDGLGSSAYFLQAGLGANYSGGGINAPCVWSMNTSTHGVTPVTATDTSTGSSFTDTGNAWVAWTTGGGTGTCASPASGAKIYAYEQTDSVVGNRCLFNASLSTPECSIAYPTSNPNPVGLILPAGTIVNGSITTANCGGTGECALPVNVATALNSATVNFAGSDIRPEDAEFAVARALTPCATAVATGSQYLGLGYSNGDAINSYTVSGSTFHVINFSLPSSYNVQIVGATPVLVAVNGSAFSSVTNISSQTLAYFLDGTYSNVGQITGGSGGTGSGVTVYLREPLSGTYNTMEYNVPNRVGTAGGSFATSQDVGLNQLSTQRNCRATLPSSDSWNPMNIATTSGARQRAIGTGQEVAAVKANASGTSMGYAFWSVANFASLASVSTAKYLQVDGIDPLLNTSTPYSTYGGAFPALGSTELGDVDLHTTANGSYPIWSLLRMISTSSSSTVQTAIQNLALATDDMVTTAGRPDFATPSQMQVVRSHFTPPAGVGQPSSSLLANGDSQLNDGYSYCSNDELGGDVGGVVIGIYDASLTQLPLTQDDSDYCANTGNYGGQTGSRR